MSVFNKSRAGNDGVMSSFYSIFSSSVGGFSSLEGRIIEIYVSGIWERYKISAVENDNRFQFDTGYRADMPPVGTGYQWRVLVNRWCFDLVNGNDVHSGDSWAVTFHNTDGVGNGSTTFTSATGGFTGKLDRWIKINGVGRRQIMSVTDDNTVVLNNTVPAGTGYDFYVGGSVKNHDEIQQSTVGGDELHFAKTPAPEDSGISGTFTKESETIVTTGSAMVANVEDCEVAWTPDSVNVTSDMDASEYKFGTGAVALHLNGAFTTGLVAHKDLGATVDCSGFTKLTMWIRVLYSAPANTIKIRLCSDTVGAVPVNSFTIPHALAGDGNSVFWYPLEIDNGGACGVAIKSVSVEVLGSIVALGTNKITIDNICVCNAISLKSMIALDPTFSSTANGLWGLKNITPHAIVLGATNSNVPDVRKYGDNTATGNIWCVSGVAPSDTVPSYPWQPYWNGNAGGYKSIVLMGGYNPATNLVDGHTCIDALTNWGTIFINGYVTYTRIYDMSFFRSRVAFNSMNSYSELENVNLACSYVDCADVRNFYFTNVHQTLATTGWQPISLLKGVLTNCSWMSNFYWAISASYINYLDFHNCSLGMSPAGQHIFNGCCNRLRFFDSFFLTSSGVGGVGAQSTVEYHNCMFDNNDWYPSFGEGFPDSYMASYNHNQVVGDYKVWKSNIIVSRDAVIKRTGGHSQRITNYANTSQFYFPEGKYLSMVISKDNKLPVVSMFVRKSDVGDSGGRAYDGAQPQLVFKANPVFGIDNDVVLAIMTVGNGVWECLQGTVPVPTNYDSIKQVLANVCLVINCRQFAWVNIENYENGSNSIYAISE